LLTNNSLFIMIKPGNDALLLNTTPEISFKRTIPITIV
jgi:hypothetical protein